MCLIVPAVAAAQKLVTAPGPGAPSTVRVVDASGTDQSFLVYDLGETGGSDTVTLLEAEIPSHTHAFRDHDIDLGELSAPAPNRSLAKSTNASAYTAAANLVAMSGQALAPAGGGQPHNNLQPYLTFYFNIALQGVFPPRG